MKHLLVAKMLLEKGFVEEANAVLEDIGEALPENKEKETTAAQTPIMSIPQTLQKRLGDKAPLFDRYTKGVVNEIVNKTKTLVVDAIKDRKERIIESIRKDFGKVGVDESKDLVNAWLKYIYRDVLDETTKNLKDILKDSL